MPSNRAIPRQKAAREAAQKYCFEGLPSVDEFLRSIRQLGVQVPLRYTLFVLGINAFDSMCRKKGFAGGLGDVIDKGRLVRMMLGK